MQNANDLEGVDTLFKQVSCPRCGKDVLTLKETLTGAVNNWGGLCSSCVTRDEEKAILDRQRDALLNKLIN